jgi:hypothetical protein
MSDFPPTFFAALDLAAKLLERFDKEALHVMRLKSLRFGSLHLDAQLVNPCLWHGVICQGPALKELQKMVLIDGPIHNLKKPRLDVFLLSVLDRFK